MADSWIEQGKNFLQTHQWGPNAKYIGVSRMMKEEDIGTLQKGKFVVSQRPRGVLSGFLAILPNQGQAVYLPPISGKVGPMRIRIRHCLEKGALFSAYWHNRKCILEDVLVWNEEPIWFTKSFEERWKCMQSFLQNYYKPDIVQGLEIQFAKYTSFANLSKPEQGRVLEFVPNDPKQKRMIWTQDRIEKQEQASAVGFLARKDAAAGPDVFTVYRGEEKLGYALVKTLAISKALRSSTQTDINIHAVWNSQFNKWEIQSVLP